MTKANIRREKLLEIVKRERIILLAKLAESLEASYMTVRRDLKPLEDDQIVSLVNGVVLYNADPGPASSDRNYSLANAGTLNIEQKDRIGARASQLLDDNDVIIIDSGSTAEFVARHIPEDKRLKILCHSINVLMEVYKRPNCSIICAGGYLHADSLLFESAEGLALIKRNRAAMAFVAAGGISLELGVTCENNYEQLAKRAIMGTSQKRILIVDSGKFGRIRSTHFADLEEFETIITDDGILSEYRDYLSDKNIELIIC